MINVSAARALVAQYEENLFNVTKEELDAAITEAATNGLTSVKFDLTAHGSNSHIAHRIMITISANGYKFNADNDQFITVMWGD